MTSQDPKSAPAAPAPVAQPAQAQPATWPPGREPEVGRRNVPMIVVALLALLFLIFVVPIIALVFLSGSVGDLLQEIGNNLGTPVP